MKAGMELFHRHGIPPIGLDRILQKAGVTKTTFYNHFESKEVFACAIINRFGEELRELIALRIDNPRPAQIKQHFLSILDAWERMGSSRVSRGCILLGSGVGTGDPNDPARQVAIENKKKLIESYRVMAQTVGFKHPKSFAARFAILADGFLVARHLYENGREAEEARRMVRELIDHELRQIEDMVD